MHFDPAASDALAQQGAGDIVKNENFAGTQKLKKNAKTLGTKKKTQNYKNGNFGYNRPPGPGKSSPGCVFTSTGGRRAPEDDI